MAKDTGKPTSAPRSYSLAMPPSLFEKRKLDDIDHFALQPSGDYTRLKDREGYKEPEQYAEAVNGQQD